MKIVFITNTDLQHRKGGWDGLGGKIYDLISDRCKCIDAIDKIHPEIRTWDFFNYRIQKLLRLPRIFPAFTSKRLNDIANQLMQHSLKSYQHILFHGSTPWVEFKPALPYSTILDCSFSTYIKTYHTLSHFKPESIKKIVDLERNFLQAAHSVFFTSYWALNQTAQDYQMSGENFVYMGQGPSDDFTLNTHDLNQKKQFLFIASDFIGKGGKIVYEGFRQFLKIYPGYKLVLVGQSPPETIVKDPNVEYLGYINKSTMEGRSKLARLYGGSEANILLTRKDISPLVIIESGYAGCPTISNPLSAIPELIEHEKTGWLIKPVPEILAQTLVKIAGMERSSLSVLREAVKLKMQKQYNWQHIIDSLMKAIER